MAGTLAERANKSNYRFQAPDRDAIVEWVNTNLEVSWQVLLPTEVRSTEAALILEHMPLLNLDGNPLASLKQVRRCWTLPDIRGYLVEISSLH